MLELKIETQGFLLLMNIKLNPKCYFGCFYVDVRLCASFIQMVLLILFHFLSNCLTICEQGAQV